MKGTLKWRILTSALSIFLAMVLTFWLSRLAPGDPLDRGQEPLPTPTSYSGFLAQQQTQSVRAQQLGLNRPTFYFAIQPAIYPDTLHRILERARRQLLIDRLNKSGDWASVQAFAKSISNLETTVYRNYQQLDPSARKSLLALIDQAWTKEKVTKLAALKSDELPLPELPEQVADLQQTYAALGAKTPTFSALWRPSFRWNGTNNQFHSWLTAVGSGDLGRSSQDGQPVWDKLTGALRWTFALNCIALTFSIVLGVYLGVLAARYEGRWLDRVVQAALFFLHSIPIFWLATLMLLFLATPDYGIQLFAGVGLNPQLAGQSFWAQFLGSWDRLLLPIFCLIIYPSLTFVVSHMRSSTIEEQQKGYVFAARARGIPATAIRWKHVFPNAIFPMITLVGNLLPGLVAGSIILEFIFNIPGVGRLLLDGIQNDDWNTVLAIVLLAAVFTVIGFLLTDMLYRYADPRLRNPKTQAHA